MDAVVKRFPEFQFAVATVSNLDQSLYNTISSNRNVVLIHGNTYDLLTHANAAIVTSGTATLETALFKVPQVVVYKMGTVGYTIAKLVVKVKFISLVNLIANKEVIRELIQDEASVKAVGDELEKLVTDEAYKRTIQDDYNSVYQTLDTGSASENAAKLMYSYLSKTTAHHQSNVSPSMAI
jgi:lipid-A-disaccharide synthase